MRRAVYVTNITADTLTEDGLHIITCDRHGKGLEKEEQIEMTCGPVEYASVKAFGYYYAYI